MSKKFKFEVGLRVDASVRGLTVHGTIKRRLFDEDGGRVYHLHNPSTSNPVFTYALINEANITAVYEKIGVAEKAAAKTKQSKKTPSATKATSVATKVA